MADSTNKTGKSKALTLEVVSSAVEKFSIEERQILRLKFFCNDALVEMKAFESELKKRKKMVSRTDEEIVDVIKSIRKRHAARI